MAARTDAACGMLRGTSGDMAEGYFQLRDGEAVDFMRAQRVPQPTAC
jgi:hypothetical protein